MIERYNDREAVRACAVKIAKRFDDPKRMAVAANGAAHALGRW